MLKHRVAIDLGGEPRVLEVGEDESLLSLLQRSPGLPFDAPCGGNGTCGKCRLLLLEGKLSAPDEIEKSLISPAELRSGARLACRALVRGDCRIGLPPRGAGAILSSFEAAGGGTDGGVRHVRVRPEMPSLADQRDLTRRFASSAGIGESALQLEHRRRLAKSSPGEPVDLLFLDNDLIDLQPSAASPAINLRSRRFGVAADIGTTTVVAYLVDLESGEVLGHEASSNPQSVYGADVISRISYAAKGDAELFLLQRRLSDLLQELSATLTAGQGGGPEQIVLLAAAGNTTMLHLLVGVTPEGIAAAPFIPAFTDAFSCPAAAVGLRLHPSARLQLLPSIAAYVGGDIVAGIIATDLDWAERPSLLVDLGTNCEVVAGSRSGLVACAAAAGPAFEGARVECGSSGLPGAVSRVLYDGELVLETVANGRPISICGSGILDAAALLVRTGIVDSSGRLIPATEAATLGAGAMLAGRIREAEPGRRFVLTPDGADREVYVSQRDLRELQLAKAAVAAAIDVLLTELDLSASQIEVLYLAGAFGSSLSPAAAGDIGLFPRLLRNRVRVVGNSAGRGAVMALRSKRELLRCSQLRERVRYVELSSHPGFPDRYVDHMMFPERGDLV